MRCVATASPLSVEHRHADKCRCVFSQYALLCVGCCVLLFPCVCLQRSALRITRSSNVTVSVLTCIFAVSSEAMTS